MTKVLTLWSDEKINEEDSLILRQTCADLPIPLDGEARKDIKTLVEAFMERNDASGLAAPQIGIAKRIIIFRNRGFTKDGASDGTWTRKDVEVLVNPRLTQQRGNQVILSEGCLSCPDIKVEIARYPEIKVRGFDIHGQKISRRYLDFVARIVQHEMDHLEGKLIVDYDAGAVFVPKKKRGFFENLFQSKTV
ncbi:MAG TPA: peptide deformylase [Syntrophales bacterium]|jgi:peptide deformylase|nr:peptide deformylase [Syntrophales bacterium]HOU77782.1 peptide deformylase [Syntrophales bacterium]HPC32969.1 peptide deformylase [Syntrophales bacterium]HQG34411.1 peptide deformylase [Syntrophales bacterium]HQI36113.1 peptide deformylase [Syntrophales bacterium]